MCIPQTEYHRILSQGEANIHEVVENGEVVMVTEYRSLDGGNRHGHVVIKVRIMSAQKDLIVHRTMLTWEIIHLQHDFYEECY